MTYPTGVNPTASSWHTRPFFHGSTSSPSFSIATSRLSSPAPASSSSLLLAYAALTTVSRTRASSSSSPRSNGFLPKVAKSRLSSSRPSRNCGSFTPSFSFFALDAAVHVPHYLDYATTTTATTTTTIVIGSSSDEEFSSFNNNNIIHNNNKINNEYEMGIKNWLSQTNTETSNMKSNLNSILLLSSANNNANTQSSSLTLSQQAQSRAPTNQEVLLLQNAFATFYSSDPSIRNIPQAVELLGQCIDIWETTHQGGDEIAGLYRVRGDGFMEMRQPKEAEQDYTKAIQYLDGPDGDKADPGERPASRLGRARSVRAMGMSASPSLALQASNDYETYLNSISNLDDDMDVDADDESSSKSATTKSSSTTTNNNKPAFVPSDVLLDGIQRNPYAAWEWGMVQRVAANYNQAAEIHNLASNAFEEIGDKPRAVICRLDRGLDLAAGLKDDTGGGDVAKVSEILETAIKSTVDVSGRDVELLQRVVAKEGEARIALSGVLWNSKEKAKAESMYGTACSRLDELNADYQSREEDRIKKGRMPPLRVQTFGFSIDDMVGAEEASCSRFKNDKFIEEKLVWPASLQMKVNKFLTLGR